MDAKRRANHSNGSRDRLALSQRLQYLRGYSASVDWILWENGRARHWLLAFVRTGHGGITLLLTNNYGRRIFALCHLRMSTR